jgi:hypothetical protein
MLKTESSHIAETGGPMKILFFSLVLGAAIGWAHNSYTGSYSGAPGQSSCHGGTSGTLVVTGFPVSYRPSQAYRIVVKRSSGSAIVNVNATTRLGTTTNVAGTFGTITNSALYAGADGGVYASPHAIDSVVFQWTAPAKGSGTVNFYASGFQGSTSSSNGQSKQIALSSTEVLAGVTDKPGLPLSTVLLNNYPNPFNPSTTIRYGLAHGSEVTLAVFNTLGQLVATVQKGHQEAGYHDVTFESKDLPSGVYLYRLTTEDFDQVRRFILLR